MPRGRPNKKLREEFERLRRLGKTYSEIQQALGIAIPKGTLSYWGNRVVVPSKYKERLREVASQNIIKARKAAVETNRKKQQAILEALRSGNQYLISKLDKDTNKLLLAMLHLGEGTKYKSHSGLVLGSSDPGIIKLYIKLLKNCYGLSADRLRCRVSYRADQDINELQNYWSSVVGIPLSQFYKTIPDPRSVGKKTLKSEYKGVCVINCLKSTRIQLELETIAHLLVEKAEQGL